MTTKPEYAALSAQLVIGKEDDELGEFYAPFAYDDAVTDYRSMIAPDAFTIGQKVPFQVSHDLETAEILGLGEIERGEGLWAIRGKWAPSTFAQEMRRVVTWQSQNGYAQQVSIGMDWRDWSVKEIGEDAEMGPKKKPRNKMGQTARWLIERVPTVHHLAMVNAGAMPGAQVDSTFALPPNISEEADRWRASSWRQATALIMGGAR